LGEFLDGFFLQLVEERMHVCTKDGSWEVFYPYWWSFWPLLTVKSSLTILGS
jgi:hypothetical protein